MGLIDAFARNPRQMKPVVTRASLALRAHRRLYRIGPEVFDLWKSAPTGPVSPEIEAAAIGRLLAGVRRAVDAVTGVAHD